MSCRRVCRELLSFVRFGELGPRSQPHLDHLAGCASCRDEVGYDREMVRRLRRALAARVEGMDPSPTVWEQILVRAQAPDAEPGSGWVARLAGIAGRRRSTTAMAGTALALVLTLNMQVVPLSVPHRSDSTGTTTVSGPQALKRVPARAVTAPPSVQAELPPVEAEPRREVAMTGLFAAFEPPAVASAPDAASQLRVVVDPPPLLLPLWLDDRDEAGGVVTADAPEPEPLAPEPTPDLGRPS